MASRTSMAPEKSGRGTLSLFEGFRASLRKTLRKPQFWFGVVGLVPTLAWYWLLSFRPVLQALRFSVQDYWIVDPAKSSFVGLDNFRILFENPLFLISVRNTFVWAILVFVGMLPISLGLSMCLVNVRRGRNFYQGLIFVPVVVSIVAISLLFMMLMDPQVGQFNQLLRQFGLPESGWISSSKSALSSVAGISIWKSLGFYVVILSAGLLNIPQELYDAARVDGVNEWQRFWHVTLPLLRHTLALVMVILGIGALQEFTAVYVLTRGGPGHATYMYNLLIYGEAFERMTYGTATAAAVLQFAVIVAISLFQLKLLQPKWSY